MNTGDLDLAFDAPLRPFRHTRVLTTARWPGARAALVLAARLGDPVRAVETADTREAWLCDQIDLVILHDADFARIDAHNDERESLGMERYNILSVPDGARTEPAVGRPFRHVSVGGTFNTFHNGHKAYLRIALNLAEHVHVFVANDSYAKERKQYRPKSAKARCEALRRFFAKMGASERVTVDRLNEVAELGAYAAGAPDLDVVLTERQYVDWFDKWNEAREGVGLAPFHVLCKARTRISGYDLASSNFVATAQPKPGRETARLF